MMPKLKNLNKVHTLISCLSLMLLTNLWSKPVEIWVNSHTDQKYYQNMIKMYQKKVDKNFKANVSAFGFMEMPDKLAVAIKSGINTPDIVQMDEMFFSMYLAHEIPFLDLTQKVKSAGLDKHILRQRMGLFAQKGKIYGLPQSVSAVMLFYRNDLFEEHKISPKDVNTWEKFMATGKKIKKPQQGLLAMDWSYFEILLRQRGTDLFKEDGSSNLDDPLVLETLEFIYKLVKEGVGIVPDRGNIFDPSFFAGDVVNNEILTIIGAGWYGLDMIQGMSPPQIKGRWSVMPLPLWTDKKSVPGRNTSTFSGQGLMIYKKSKNTKESWSFIKYIMEDIDANVERFLQGNAFTAFRPAWADLRFSKKDSVFGGQSLGNLMIELGDKIPTQRQSPMRAYVVNLFREKYWQQIMGGTLTPKQGLAELKKEISKK